jgi:hypothetical protein
MELNIYILSGITTNECRKYWVLPTPLYAYFPKPEMYWQFGQNGLYIDVSNGITNSFNINRHSSNLVKRNVVETDFGNYRLYGYNGDI